MSRCELVILTKVWRVQEDERLAEELLAQFQQQNAHPNWHVCSSLLDIYTANNKPEKALSFIKKVTDAAQGKLPYAPVRAIPFGKALQWRAILAQRMQSA